MDFLEGILKERSGDLLGALTGGAGFSAEQAEKFLPEAGSKVGQVIASKASDLDLSDMASASNIGAIMSGLDVAGLASKVGVSTEQGTNGLTALLPMLLGFLGDKGKDAGGLLGLLGGGEGLGDALGALKGLGGFLK